MINVNTLPVKRDLRLAYALSLVVAGVLLWQRQALGYVAGAGLLLQYGLSAIRLVASMALQALLTASGLDVVASVVLLVFGIVCFVPLVLFFLRGAAGRSGRERRIYEGNR